MADKYRIGIDLGGTKIASILLDTNNNVICEKRIASPRNSYTKTVSCIREIVFDLERDFEHKAFVGIGIPGSVSPQTGLVQNANSTWLNGQPLRQDLTSALGREIRMENDANCFALSEALDGAGRGSDMVFGVIIGTGCGGGLVFGNRLIRGPHAIGGEWGHIPLPWPTAAEVGVVKCWCGRQDCIEGWISGTGMAADHFRVNRVKLEAADIAKNAEKGNLAALATLDRFMSRLGRGLAVMVNIIDPDVIVLGGGLSNIDMIYDKVPEIMRPYIFADHFKPRILRPTFGDASGVHGAAHLWP
jgi:fructokinase